MPGQARARARVKAKAEICRSWVVFAGDWLNEEKSGKRIAESASGHFAGPAEAKKKI